MTISVDLTKSAGKIKVLNAVGSGPVVHHGDEAHISQDIQNDKEYKAMRAPYARTHDGSCEYWYGGEHCVDMSALFPNEDADEFDPKSYDFFLTDEYFQGIKDAGTEIFFRFGTAIELMSKQYFVFPPKDFEKFARVCEHIIRHMNEGWGEGGQHFGIKYWEIWNEPNLDLCWGGTLQQYIDMYIVTAKHLKKCFPDLKIGGPAFCGYPEEFVHDFLRQVRDAGAPLDFCSWHEYAAVTSRFVKKMRDFRHDLDTYGFTKTESICDEWNYTRAFSGPGWRETIRTIIGMKGAAFASAVMTTAQHEPVDMMMYYESRPDIMNGLFDLYQLRPLKTYYVVKTMGDLYWDFKNAVKVTGSGDPLYAIAAKDKKGDFMTVITYYTDNKADGDVTFDLEIKGAEGRTLSLFLLDKKKDNKKIGNATVKDGKLTLTMAPNTVLTLRTDK